MALAQWSTTEVAPSERFAYWREAVCDAFLDLRPERADRGGFHGRIVVERRDHLEIARVAAAAQHVHRRPSHDGGWCYLNVQASGTGMTGQAGQTVITEPGDAVVVRTDRPFEFRFDEPFVQVSVRLPDDLSSLVEAPVLLPGGSPAGVALRALLDLTLVAGRRQADPADGSPAGEGNGGARIDEWLDNALLDLVRAAIRSGATEGGPVARLELWPMIDADIDRHLRDPRLTPAATARRVGLSVRSLHQHFRSRPRTFAREVRHRRLSMARRLLLDPGHDGLRVRDIAADCGFVDVHHFQKIYRQAFDQSPGATRRSR
ncbi:MAG: helix-turn-helix domain-containing protein [Actinomycetota bacterium]